MRNFSCRASTTTRSSLLTGKENCPFLSDKTGGLCLPLPSETESQLSEWGSPDSWTKRPVTTADAVGGSLETNTIQNNAAHKTTTVTDLSKVFLIAVLSISVGLLYF